MSGLNEEYIVSHFSEAIENGCIQPYFQPIFRSFTEKICASEAQRWHGGLTLFTGCSHLPFSSRFWKDTA